MKHSQPPFEATCINDINLPILERRYLKKDESGKPIEKPEDLFWRVAVAVASAELNYGATEKRAMDLSKEFYALMAEGKFEPNSPTLMNAGRDNNLALSACFVLPISDSLVRGHDSIYQTLTNMAAIHQSGGGTGFSFSNLRPEGAIVNSTLGVASGPISFMSLYDASTDVVKQGGTRRGANMGILRIDHPDILKFVHCKSDVSHITNFNISVAVTDDFMRAVKNDEYYDLVDPKTQKTVKKTKAREVFDAIIRQAHATGEPGLFFIDEANRHNPVPHLGTYEATNPCVVGDTLVMTTDGPVPVKNLKTPVEILVDGQPYRCSGFFETGIKPVYKLETQQGMSCTLTADHKVLTASGRWVEAQNLVPGDDIVLHRHQNLEWKGTGGTHEEGFLFAADVGIVKGKPKNITPELEGRSSSFCAGFLTGLFDADGSVQGTAEKGISVRLSQSSRTNLEAVQRMLLRFEINSTIYLCKDQYDLVVSNDSLVRFADKIGFVNQAKSEKLDYALASYTRGPYQKPFIATVKDVIPAGVETVYDAQVPGINAFDANGLYVHNCGEQPLLPYDVCNLGSINLGKYVVKNNGLPVLDKPALVRDIKKAVRFLDNVIDVNRYPLQEIADLSYNIRRIGLGVMGWADYLIRMGIPYGTQESIILAKDVMSIFQEAAHKASEELAQERGTFPEWENSVWGPDESCARFEDGSRIRPMRPLRNCNITTVAPTGTISIIAGCSGGIEPLFSIAFMRNQAGLRLPDVNKDFLALAQKEGWYDEALFEQIADTGSIDFEEVPTYVKELFMTSHTVSQDNHVRMQAAFQEHCDSAISKTINLPNKATVQDVERAYLLAYELGCKGITVYRDGARPNQVLTAGKAITKTEQKSEEPVPQPQSTQRPEFTYGFTRKLQFAHFGKVYITVNFDEGTGKAVETFIQLGKAGSDENSFAEALARMISLYLKDGGDIKNVIKQLRGIGGRTFAFHNGKTYSSIPDAVGDTLKAAIIDGEKMADPQQLTIFGNKCPQCNEELVKAEGCNKCPACGYSTCG